MARKYCKATTIGHEKSKLHIGCLKPICDILSSEGEKKSPQIYKSSEALDLDDVEASCKKAQSDPTCDFMIGIANEGKNKRIVLVECKFNKKPNHLAWAQKAKLDFNKHLLIYIV